jgi:signal transduction histidine kinase
VLASQPESSSWTSGTRIPVTHFAPAERVSIDIVHRQAGSFSNSPLAPILLNSVLNYVFVLNAQRQIVFASRNVLELTPGKTMEDLLGKRPGEALGCVRASECVSGCGTSEFCSQCGAVRAILTGLAGNRDLQECRMIRVVNCQAEALDLMVLATPLAHENESYLVLSVADISHEKRRRALERIFFHDVINLAGGADGLLEDLAGRAPSEVRSDLELSRATVHELLEEVQNHRDLAAAEREELALVPVTVRSEALLAGLARLYSCHPMAAGRQICVAPFSRAETFTADATLLKRVLGNLIKNAVEASAESETVTLGCERAGNGIRFSVHNPGVMPREVQLQVFNRSFSTKGAGRGLGTYSVKLLTERYLKGAVAFTSLPGQGTSFFVTLPLTAG